jgi:polysaccharide deacetylase 2 family uncharacterized protein YibQ
MLIFQDKRSIMCQSVLPVQGNKWDSEIPRRCRLYVINASLTPAMLRDTIKYTPPILTSSQFFTFKMAQKWYERISDGKNILMQYPMNSNSDFSASNHCSTLERPK